jgi:hypothetical protein
VVTSCQCRFFFRGRSGKGAALDKLPSLGAGEYAHENHLRDTGRTEFESLECDKVDPLQTDALEWVENPLSSKAAHHGTV